MRGGEGTFQHNNFKAATFLLQTIVHLTLCWRDVRPKKGQFAQDEKLFLNSKQARDENGNLSHVNFDSLKKCLL